MALELTEDFIKDNGLSVEQVKAVTTHANKWHDDKVIDLKGEYDGKANTDAQGILDGAMGLIATKTSVKRNDGEKAGEYIPRAWAEFSKTSQSELDTAKSEYEQKVKDFKGDEATRAELDKAKEDLDTAQKKYADYDTHKDNSDKYSPLLDEFNTMKLRVAYSGVKPSFPDTVNSFEADAKWKEFIAKVETEYTIEFDGDNAVAVSKENKHKVIQLKDLVSKDETLIELMKGRQQKGSGSTQVDMQTIDGVPFDVPKDATVADKSKLTRDYLLKEGIKTTNPEYSKKFGEIIGKINA